MSMTDLVNEMSDPKLIKEIVTTAIEAFAEDICDFFKKFPIPAGMTKAQAADTFIRALGFHATMKQAGGNITTEQYLIGIAASAFLVEHIDEIVAKVVELEGDQTIVTE